MLMRASVARGQPDAFAKHDAAHPANSLHG